jgi:hypothetical protein
MNQTSESRSVANGKATQSIRNLQKLAARREVGIVLSNTIPVASVAIFAVPKISHSAMTTNSYGVSRIHTDGMAEV